MADLSLNGDPEPLRKESKNDDIEELKFKTEKHDHESILNSLKIDKE